MTQKIYNLSFSDTITCVGSKSIKQYTLGPKFLDGQSLQLGEHRNLHFTSCTSNGQYCITQNGLLVMIQSLSIEKWVDLKMNATSIDMDNWICCGGSNGTVRLFEPDTLRYIATLPKPDPLFTDIQTGNLSFDHDLVYPSVLSLKLISNKLLVVYSNKQMILWDITDTKQPQRVHVNFSHSDCVYGIKSLDDSLISWSADGTLRFWNQDFEIRKILYVDPEGLLKIDTQSNEKTGIRACAVDPTSRMIACGNRQGNIHIYDHNLSLLVVLEAHTSEVMCLDFTRLSDGTLLLGSCSRDRQINIFNCSKTRGSGSFDLIQTLEDHTSTITSLKFTSFGMMLISCGQDKSVIFRSLQEGPVYYTLRNTPLRSTVYDMTLRDHLLITCNQDRKMYFFEMESGKIVRTQPSTGNFISCVVSHPHGPLLGCASGKSVKILDAISLQTLAEKTGHGDIVTSITFVGDSMVSTSNDGSIFVWKLSPSLLKRLGTPQSPYLEFDETQLPLWARSAKTGPLDPVFAKPKGRWAERVDPHNLLLYSETENDPVVAHPKSPGRRYSVDSQTSLQSSVQPLPPDLSQPPPTVVSEVKTQDVKIPDQTVPQEPPVSSAEQGKPVAVENLNWASPDKQPSADISVKPASVATAQETTVETVQEKTLETKTDRIVAFNQIHKQESEPTLYVVSGIADTIESDDEPTSRLSSPIDFAPTPTPRSPVRSDHSQLLILAREATERLQSLEPGEEYDRLARILRQTRDILDPFVPQESLLDRYANLMIETIRQKLD
ncbi:WD40-repeat-containing domain protein [Gorgonomyces haynaldii]|nr:WD40-repeat-containing domain protein [Gorgonomyces haynaldii]